MNRRALLAFGAGLAATLALGWLGLPAFLYARVEQPAAFNHKLHTSQAGLGCQDCHAVRADGSFSGIPSVAKCAECHGEPLGTSAAEKRLVEEFITPGREIPWRVYARQPDNVRFPHALHVGRAGIACERCHGPHGTSETLRPYEANRLSGYSRDIWGPSLSRLGRRPGEGMKMSDCEGCHAPARTSCLACHQ